MPRESRHPILSHEFFCPVDFNGLTGSKCSEPVPQNDFRTRFNLSDRFKCFVERLKFCYKFSNIRFSRKKKPATRSRNNENVLHCISLWFGFVNLVYTDSRLCQSVLWWTHTVTIRVLRIASARCSHYHYGPEKPRSPSITKTYRVLPSRYTLVDKL